eukprot:5767835-Amphidinium_carterae.2
MEKLGSDRDSVHSDLNVCSLSEANAIKTFSNVLLFLRPCSNKKVIRAHQHSWRQAELHLCGENRLLTVSM